MVRMLEPALARSNLGMPYTAVLVQPFQDHRESKTAQSYSRPVNNIAREFEAREFEAREFEAREFEAREFEAPVLMEQESRSCGTLLGACWYFPRLPSDTISKWAM
jgi:hypothetical protein